MVDSTDRFGNARIKLDWADQHIKNLIACWRHFLGTDYCQLIVEDSADGPGQIVRVASLDGLPSTLVLLIGDAVHNLKSTLDYAISEILGSTTTRLTFPMGETRDELELSFRTEGQEPCSSCGRGGKGKGRNASLELAFPGIGQFIVEKIQPYKGGKDNIWALNKLDVRDKHRLLIPVLVPQKVYDFVARDRNRNSIAGSEFTFQMGQSFNLAAFGAGGVTIESFKIDADLRFNELGVLENISVLPALLGMLESVSDAIDLIEMFAVDSGWTGASKD